MIELELKKNELLSALMAISGAVDKKQSLVILSNILFSIEEDRLQLTATDLEIEMTASVPYIKTSGYGKITIPAKKLVDIIRSLDQEHLVLSIDEQVVIVKAGKGKFKLAVLPAHQFPINDYSSHEVEFTIPRTVFHNLLLSTSFAMAQQDVRVFINSLFLDFIEGYITAVAMDGHRMAVSRYQLESTITDAQFLLPRRGVQELQRLISILTDEAVTIQAGKGYLKLNATQYSFITKLTEAKFPPYRKAIPRGHDKFILMDRENLKRTLSRIVILANEKTHAVMLHIENNAVLLIARNQEQEEASEQIEATVDGEPIKIGLNALYLLDVLNYLPDGLVRLSLSSTEQSILVESVNDESYQYIIMPMKL